MQNIGRGNATGTQPFDAIPADAVVPQSSFKDIQVSFRPDDESLFYSCALEVVVPNQKEKSIYTLLGRCWAQAMCVALFPSVQYCNTLRMYCRLPVTLSDALPSLLSRTLGPGAAVGAGGIDRFDPPAQGSTRRHLAPSCPALTLTPRPSWHDENAASCSRRQHRCCCSL